MLGAAAPFGRTKPASLCRGTISTPRKSGVAWPSRTLLASRPSLDQGSATVEPGPAGPADPSPLAETPPLQVALHPLSRPVDGQRCRDQRARPPWGRRPIRRTPATEPAGDRLLGSRTPRRETSEISSADCGGPGSPRLNHGYQVLMKRQERRWVKRSERPKKSCLGCAGTPRRFGLEMAG